MTSFRYHSILSPWAKCQSHARYRTWLHVRVVSHLCTRRTEYRCHRHAQCHERALTIMPHNDVHSDSPEFNTCIYVHVHVQKVLVHWFLANLEYISQVCHIPSNRVAGYMPRSPILQYWYKCGQSTSVLVWFTLSFKIHKFLKMTGCLHRINLTYLDIAGRKMSQHACLT